jgi:hypothetical protein
MCIASDNERRYTSNVIVFRQSEKVSIMLRGAISLILILGILLCPLCCGGAVGAESAAPSAQSSDACLGCGCGQSTGDEHEPSPCHDGCDRDCICKGLLAGQVKLLLACVSSWLSAGGEHSVAVPASATLSMGTRPLNSTLPDLSSGVAIRLAFASLLI